VSVNGFATQRRKRRPSCAGCSGKQVWLVLFVAYVQRSERDGCGQNRADVSFVTVSGPLLAPSRASQTLLTNGASVCSASNHCEPEVRLPKFADALRWAAFSRPSATTFLFIFRPGYMSSLTRSVSTLLMRGQPSSPEPTGSRGCHRAPTLHIEEGDHVRALSVMMRKGEKAHVSSRGLGVRHP